MSWLGETRPINPKEAYDEIFEGNYTYFKEKGEFRQTVKILTANPVISGSYDYQVCSDIDGKCIPFDEEFQFEGLKVLAGNFNEPVPKEVDQTPDPKSEDSPLAAGTESTSETFPELLPMDEDIAPVDPAIESPSPKEHTWAEKTSHTPFSLISFLITAFFAGF